jgi:hypothetical protein
MFQSSRNPEFVDYIAFSDEMESVFTKKGLERTPTSLPTEFTNYVYESGSRPFQLVDPSLESPVLNRVLSRLAESIRERRLDMHSYLANFDFVNEGTITTNQFRSALGTIGLAIDDEENMELCARFGTTRNNDRVNYRSFAGRLTAQPRKDDTGTRFDRVTVQAHSLW